MMTIFAMLLLLATPAAAQVCAPLADALVIIGEQNPVVQVVPLDDAQTIDVVAWYNRQDPTSEEHWTLAVVVKHKNGSLGLMLGNDGKICQAMIIPSHLVLEFIKAIIGDAA